MKRLANAVAVLHANGGSEGGTSEKEKKQQAKAAKANSYKTCPSLHSSQTEHDRGRKIPSAVLGP